MPGAWATAWAAAKASWFDLPSGCDRSPRPRPVCLAVVRRLGLPDRRCPLFRRSPRRRRPSRRLTRPAGADRCDQGEAAAGTSATAGTEDPAGADRRPDPAAQPTRGAAPQPNAAAADGDLPIGSTVPGGQRRQGLLRAGLRAASARAGQVLAPLPTHALPGTQDRAQARVGRAPAAASAAVQAHRGSGAAA